MLDAGYAYECSTCDVRAVFTTRTERDIEIRDEHAEHDIQTWHELRQD